MLKLFEQIENIILNEWQFVNHSINKHNIKNKSNLFEDCVIIRQDPENDVNKKMIRARRGIYIFLFNEPFNMSAAEVIRFNHLKGAKINGCGEVNIPEGHCLYVGSASKKSLYSRLREHYRSDFTGSSLHLGNEKRKKLLGIVQAYAFPIKKEYEKYIKIIMPFLEKKLHEDFMPLAGSSRT